MVAVALWSNADSETVLLAVAASVPAWQRDGACIEHPEIQFFPAQGGRALDAKAVCAACLVQSECLGFALDLELGDGIFGGASPAERKQLRRRGITGDLIRRFGSAVGQGREVVLDEAAMFGGFEDDDVS